MTRQRAILSSGLAQTGGTAQRIRPVSFLAEGQHGQIYVGMDEVLRRRVVVKKLTRHSFDDARSRLRLIEEARTLCRLDHPNVLRIHDYSEEEGDDVFTIEFVAGTMLPEALEHGADFAKKVRIATAVASALVVAHRNDVVHGALSPASVMIAEKGDVKVVDFTSTSTHLEQRRVDPRWLSPEQKRGEEAARPSDMFAFGLLLRELFGESDRDVRAIVASLVRDVPSERATAAVTLTGLHQLGRRRARRIRSAAIALLAALFLFGGAKYTVDLRRERSEALAAKAEADARRAEASRLVSFMIVDLRPKLDSVGRLAIMDAATTKGLDYFASIHPDDISPNEAAVHVEAFIQLAEVQINRSDVPAALATLRRAVNLGETMVPGQPDDLELRYALAHAHATTSIALDRNGDTAGALRHSRACAAVASELVRHAPRDVRFLRAVAVARSNLGSIHDRREEIAASLREFTTAVAMKRRALTLDRSDGERRDLSITVIKAATALFRLGRFQEARVMLEEERAELESVVARQSRDMRMHWTLGLCDEHLSMIAFATGDIASAARHATNHLSTLRDLVAFDPENVDWTRQLATAQLAAGTAARLSGDHRGALEHHHAAIAALSGIAESERRAKNIVREMERARVDHARSLLAAGLPAAAGNEAHRAAAELRQIRDDLAARRTLGEALLVEGEARAARGDRDGAFARWEEALAVLEPLDALSTDPRIADSHARVLLLLGRVDRAQPLIEELSAIGYRHPEFETLRVKESVPRPQ